MLGNVLHHHPDTGDRLLQLLLGHPPLLRPIRHLVPLIHVHPRGVLGRAFCRVIRHGISSRTLTLRSSKPNEYPRKSERPGALTFPGARAPWGGAKNAARERRPLRPEPGKAASSE